MNKISKRLETISSLVSDNSVVGDIGCDHGLLDIYLYQHKKNIKIIASDINKNALDSAISNIKGLGLSNEIEIRLGNGLEPYQYNEVDTLILAGMGTYTIIDILRNNLDKIAGVRQIIIQSNTKIELLRKEVTSLNYFIDEEIMLIDKGIYYTIISFKKGKKKYKKYELYFGPVLLNKKDKIFKDYYNREYNRLFNILTNLPKLKIMERIKIKKILKMYKYI